MVLKMLKLLIACLNFEDKCTIEKNYKEKHFYSLNGW